MKLENWKVHPWNTNTAETYEHTCVKSVEELEENEPNPDIQVIGTGEKLDRKILPFLHQNNFSFKI